MRLIIKCILCIVMNKVNVVSSQSDMSNTNIDHTVVTEDKMYPYVVAVLKKSVYISAGALIDENWVLTAADSLFFIREAVRTLRVRLGSTSYKRGGVLTAIKYLQIHPYFDDRKPEFDMALIRLSDAVKLSPNLNPIKLQTKSRKIIATSYTVAGWQPLALTDKNIPLEYASEESMKRRQLLLVSHVFPSSAQDCADQLEMMEANHTQTLMCLERSETRDPCERDIGAPVVLNGILWGIISSWKSEDCDLVGGSIFATMVSPVEISSWIHSTIHGHRWSQKHTVDYTDNFI